MSDKIHSLDDFQLLLRGVKPGKDGQCTALCPGHDDRNRSLSVKQADGKLLIKCFAGCATADILKPLSLEVSDLFFNSHKSKPERCDIEAIYHYDDFEVVRTRPKGFYQRRPDGKGDYINNLKGITPTLYHKDELAAAINTGNTIYIVEGEKDADRLRAGGFVATCNPMGAGKWRDSYSEALKEADVVIIQDNDGPGRDHAAQVARSCYGKAKRVRLLGLPDTNDASEYLNKGHSINDITVLVSQCQDYRLVKLDEILNRAKKYLFLPDTGSLEITLGVVAANMLSGDPVWLLIVSPPGSGKTEILNSVSKVKNVHQIATLTEASLLSGTPRKDSQGSKGGLLNELGDYGVIQVKDFGGVLSLNRDCRGPILAALREVYDGSWTRYIGSDGGRKLTWVGKCGLVGGATPSIDGYYAVLSILGERFAYYRLPESDELDKAEAALCHAGHESEIRAELSNMVADFLDNLDITKAVDLIPEDHIKLINLALFATRCRSAVERDTYSSSREIQLIPGAESPTRLVKVLAQLLRGLQLIGLTAQRAWQIVEKVGIDSMPALRQKIILAMLESNQDEHKTSKLAIQLGYPTNTTRRTLEDLDAYSIVKRRRQGDGNADMWSLTDWTRHTYAAATKTLPQIRGGIYTTNNRIINDTKRICSKVAADDTSELPDCPTCGRNEWSISPDGKPLCPCSKSLEGVGQ